MTKHNQNNHFSAFRSVPKTGVIYVTEKAYEHGYKSGHPDWINLGQGSPETGTIPDPPIRLENIPSGKEMMEYGDVVGIPDLRKAVAELYNHRFRRGMASQYGVENVAIAPGGRSGLVRMAAALRHTNIGHFIPDYTAYAELLDTFRILVPIPILLSENDGYKLHPERLRDEIRGMGLGAVLSSNPCNPTGQIMHGANLAASIKVSCELQCSLILDEFYSHYHYNLGIDTPSVSGAAFIEDVNKDPIVIIDGLSKNWRYPGLRLSWTPDPAKAIETIASAGSFLDGGASHPGQRAILPLLYL